MARHREPKVALPQIEIDDEKAVRFKIKGRLHGDLLDYCAAYTEAYDRPIDLEALVPHILERFLASDRGFRAWQVARKDEPAADEAPLRIAAE